MGSYNLTISLDDTQHMKPFMITTCASSTWEKVAWATFVPQPSYSYYTTLQKPHATISQFDAAKNPSRSPQIMEILEKKYLEIQVTHVGCYIIKKTQEVNKCEDTYSYLSVFSDFLEN